MNKPNKKGLNQKRILKIEYFNKIENISLLTISFSVFFYSL